MWLDYLKLIFRVQSLATAHHRGTALDLKAKPSFKTITFWVFILTRSILSAIFWQIFICFIYLYISEHITRQTETDVGVDSEVWVITLFLSSHYLNVNAVFWVLARGRSLRLFWLFILISAKLMIVPSHSAEPGSYCLYCSLRIS